MKTTVYITKKLVFAVLFLVIGLYCTLYGIRSLYREFRCIPLADLTMSNYRKGAYVAGMIDACLTVDVETINGYKPLGTAGGFITNFGATIYDCYTIPMADSHYIRIQLSDEDTKNAVDAMIAGKSEGVYVEGQIVKQMIGRNMPWYEHCEQIKNPQEEVLDIYEIRQISISNRRNVLYFGLGMTAVMILIIWKSKLITEAYDVEEESEEQPIEIVENREFEPWKPQYLGGAEHETSEMEKE